MFDEKSVNFSRYYGTASIKQGKEAKRILETKTSLLFDRVETAY
jgi:hypothetical protein